MKKIFCLTIILLSAICSLAQERAIEKAEFDAALKNRFRKFAGQSYRMTTRSENTPTNPGAGKVGWKSVTEFMESRASRMVYEFDSPTIKAKMETVRIDGKTYTRKNDGEWTETAPLSEPEKPSAPNKKFEIVEEQTEYKWLGSEIFDKFGANVYAKIEKKKMVNEADKQEMYSTIVTKYWLDQDGGILKEETLLENQFKSERKPTGGIYRTLRTSVWEFDPNIKIETPVLVK